MTRFDTMAPMKWPVREGARASEPRFFGDGRFFTGDRKARFIAPEIPRREPRPRRTCRCGSTPAASAINGTP